MYIGFGKINFISVCYLRTNRGHGENCHLGLQSLECCTGMNYLVHSVVSPESGGFSKMMLTSSADKIRFSCAIG